MSSAWDGSWSLGFLHKWHQWHDFFLDIVVFFYILAFAFFFLLHDAYLNQKKRRDGWNIECSRKIRHHVIDHFIFSKRGDHTDN